MRLRRLLLIPIVLGFLALAGWMYFFYEPQPDPKLACYWGAYGLSDGRTVAIGPSSGTQSMRFILMDGDTGRLLPSASSQPGKGMIFTGGPGWADETPVRSRFEFGTCTDEAMMMSLDGNPAERATKLRFDVEETTFQSHGLALRGRLVMPRVEGAVPVAVLVHGSERDSALVFSRMQHLLPANGIGVFVYDKRGTGQSQGSYSQNFHLLSDDAAAALTAARKLAGPRASEVGFEGGSQAGWIEPLAATKVKTDFVLVGYGLVESPLAEDREEVMDDLRTAGYGPDVLVKAREITDVTGLVMSSRFTEGFEALDGVRAKYGRELWFEKINGEFTGDFLRYPNWLLMIFGSIFDVGTSWNYDPLPALRAYNGPHLWILAGRDSSAPSENTLRILREVQATHPRLDVVMFPNSDHGIIEFVEKNGKRERTRYATGYFQLIADWINFKQPQTRGSGPVVYEGDGKAE